MPTSRTSKLVRTVLLMLPVLLFIFPDTVRAHPLPKQILRTQTVPDSETLIESSDLIVLAHLDASIHTWSTGRSISPNIRLVNARQTLHIRQILKGAPPSPTYLLTTGALPLPKPDDPLNRLYTGPLADGDYILFLKAFPSQPYYTLNGGFSAVYPMYGGRVMALREGFDAFHQKTVEEMKAIIQPSALHRLQNSSYLSSVTSGCPSARLYPPTSSPGKSFK
ncbi:hypothetical protein EWH99_03215 [Sporolactobacillus sp. THM7-7]|nr:hypothetical protein EWH99_03215 [Sporolactobacillus sp. THM7-7]